MAINLNHIDNSILIGTNERLRIDSDGRCIVGGGSHAGGSALVVKGGNQNTYSTIGMFSNHTNPSDDTLLSQIRFGSNTSAVGADIRVYADADWGTNDYPTRLSFYTTPDSSNSRQERLRITGDGTAQFSGTGGSAVNSAINRQVFEIGSLGGILLGSYDDARRATPADASTITGLRAPNILDWGLDRGDSSYQAGDSIPNSFNATWVNYSLNGSTTSNIWKIGQGPHGGMEWLWSGKSNDGSTGANGGWNTGFKIDPHYTYMFITYVKRVSSTSNGNWYVGAGGNVASLGSGATAGLSNPYWTCGGTGNLSQNVWHVGVHYARSYHSSNTDKLPNAGTYRMSDGSRIADGANCNVGNGMKYNTTSTGATVNYRSYLFYTSANDGTELHWAQPHAYKCDGTEPTLMELLGRELANSDDSNNWDG